MNVAVKAVKHAAPGPYLGFALQVRLCYHLLTCPKGAQVSLGFKIISLATFLWGRLNKNCPDSIGYQQYKYDRAT